MSRIQGAYAKILSNTIYGIISPRIGLFYGPKPLRGYGYSPETSSS